MYILVPLYIRLELNYNLIFTTTKITHNLAFINVFYYIKSAKLRNYCTYDGKSSIIRKIKV